MTEVFYSDIDRFSRDLLYIRRALHNEADKTGEEELHEAAEDIYATYSKLLSVSVKRELQKKEEKA